MQISSGESPAFVVLAARSAEVPLPSPAPHDSVVRGQPLAAVVLLNAQGHPLGPARYLRQEDLPGCVAAAEAARPRWVWESTRHWYGMLLQHGVTVERAWDLALVRTILRRSPVTSAGSYAQSLPPESEEADAESPLPRPAWAAPVNDMQESLFAPPEPVPAGPTVEDVAEEFRAQLSAFPRSPDGKKLELLATAESVGALIAAEIRATGMPWRTDIHAALLEDRLGPKPPLGQRPVKMERLAEQLRAELGAPRLNPDSPQELLRALHRAGIDVSSTNQWELAEHNHPALETLEQYKKLARLFTANGWAWLDAWIHQDRFWPDYTVGGVVTGRWSARGGGALQIPATVRSAVRAEPSMKLIVADAAQLEPRILAAMSQDRALATAARGKDLYAGIAAQGFGGERSHAKVAMLGAIYGQTSGEAGRLMGQLTKSYPHAVGLVEHAAAEGRAGRIVTTFLGRGCPPPDRGYVTARKAANALNATSADQSRAEAVARQRGRFTRNFVVQGTAAEWALCWLGQIRHSLRQQLPDHDARIVFFLHDEVMLHVPEAQAHAVVTLIHQAAARATQLVFRQELVETPVNVAVVDSYDQAK